MSNTERELRTQIVHERAMRIKDYDDAYPDVGMGMSWGSCVAEAVKQLGYIEEQFDRKKLFE
jgi:hypothetical protein